MRVQVPPSAPRAARAPLPAAPARAGTAPAGPPPGRRRPPAPPSTVPLPPPAPSRPDPVGRRSAGEYAVRPAGGSGVPGWRRNAMKIRTMVAAVAALGAPLATGAFAQDA